MKSRNIFSCPFNLNFTKFPIQKQKLKEKLHLLNTFKNSEDIEKQYNLFIKSRSIAGDAHLTFMETIREQARRENEIFGITGINSMKIKAPMASFLLKHSESVLYY